MALSTAGHGVGARLPVEDVALETSHHTHPGYWPAPTRQQVLPG